MKTLVFSDTHLAHRFDQAKCEFLQRIISKHDRVIINGDFWDGYFIDFAQFVESPWKQLFPYLKERSAIYIYGNHDPEAWADERTQLFANTTTHHHVAELFGKEYEITHGHSVMPGYHEWGLPPKPLRTGVDYFYRLEKWGIKLFGSEFRNLYWYRSWDNRKIRKKVREVSTADYFLCGHTHQARGGEEDHYLNSGCVAHGVGTYISISDSGPKLITERY